MRPRYLVLLLVMGCRGVDDSDARRLVHGLAARGEVDELRKLLEEKPDLVDVQYDRLSGHTPLHTAAMKGQAAAVRLLLDKGAKVEQRDNTPGGLLPLHYAARKGNWEALEALLAKGAKIDAPSKSQRSALDIAATEGHLEVVRRLIMKGADVKRRVGLGSGTALHAAAGAGHTKVAAELIAHGAEVDAKADSGVTPLYHACAEGHQETARFLLSKGAKPDILSATVLGDVKGVNRFLAEDPSLLQFKLPFGANSLLHIAARNNQNEVLTVLLEKKLDPNLAIFEIRPLHLAAQYGHVEVAKTLVRFGADVNARDERGTSALHFAAEKDRFEFVDLLLASKADANTKNREGDTPLHFAVTYLASEKTVQRLLEGGASIAAKNENGRTPYDAATFSARRTAYLALFDKYKR